MSGSCPLNIIPSYPINTINCAKQQKKLTPQLFLPYNQMPNASQSRNDEINRIWTSSVENQKPNRVALST